MTTLRGWLEAAPFSLTLSSGFFGFFAHAGMLAALEEAGLFPREISGSSAGALVGGFWAAGLDSAAICEPLLGLRREDFWDPGVGPGLLRGRLFRELLHELLPVKRFEDCRARLAVSAFDLATFATKVIDRGSLAHAIHASCAVPLLFQPVWIDSHPCIDGGVSDRPGLAGMSDGRVLHHHLSAKSPWRLRAPQPPQRPSLVALVIEDLPRVNPFRLERGPAALQRAFEATRRALDRPLAGSGPVIV